MSQAFVNVPVEVLNLRTIGISRHRQLPRGTVAILSETVAIILYREKPIGTAPAVVAGAALLRRASRITFDKTTDTAIIAKPSTIGSSDTIFTPKPESLKT